MLEHDPLRALVQNGLIVEAAVALLVLLIPAVRRRIERLLERWLPAFDRLADRRGRSVWVCGVVALAGCVAAGLVRPPVPRVHDEFSYLLGADTFAHGRLTNRPPLEQVTGAGGAPAPQSAHFESEHILIRPTYSSKYPPGQALFLAAGQVLLKAPIAGVWLSTALLCAAICWMLQAWTTARYALLGGLLAALHVGVIGWWGNTFWGGSVAGLGGALLFGALRRLADGASAEQATGEEGTPRARDSALLGLGVALLAASRPYEGALACAPAAAVMAWLLLRRLGRPAALLRTAGPAGAIALLAAAGLGLHNRAVTGDALTFPYMAHARQYSATPVFLWQKPPTPPAYPHRHLEDFHGGWERTRFERQATPAAFVQAATEKTIAMWLFYVGAAFTLLLLLAPALALRRRGDRPARRGIDGWTLLALGTCALVVAGVLAVPWINPHYLAPIFAPALFLLVRFLEVRERVGDLGRSLAALVPARLAAFIWLWPGLLLSYPDSPQPWHLRRAEIQRELAAEDGPDLVIVRHGREFRPHEEWVYNGADLKSEPVVWAWELNARSNAALLSRFAGRRAWLLDAYRDEPARLSPYPSPPAWLLQEPIPLPASGAFARVAAVDLDGDGRAEVVAFGPGGQVSGVFGWRDGAMVALPRGAAAEAVRAGAIPAPADPLRASVDLDGDGAEETVIVNAPEDTLSILASSTLSLAGVTVHTGINAQRLLAADVDFDGDEDLVVAALHGHGLAITINDGGTLRPAPALVTVGARTWFVDKLLLMDAADVDGDGRTDLVVAGPAGAFVYATSRGGAG